MLMLCPKLIIDDYQDVEPYHSSASKHRLWKHKVNRMHDFDYFVTFWSPTTVFSLSSQVLKSAQYMTTSILE